MRDAGLIGRELSDFKKICAIYFLDNFYNKRISFVKTNEERLREGFKKKSKNMMEFSIIGLTPPSAPMMENFLVKSQSGGPPPQGEKNFNAFLHHLEPIQKKSNLMMEWP